MSLCIQYGMSVPEHQPELADTGNLYTPVARVANDYEMLPRMLMKYQVARRALRRDRLPDSAGSSSCSASRRGGKPRGRRNHRRLGV